MDTMVPEEILILPGNEITSKILKPNVREAA